ncbi:MAG: hypothetical protein ACOCQX_04905 [Candidatus Nanoarchaeia archaeon]
MLLFNNLGFAVIVGIIVTVFFFAGASLISSSRRVVWEYSAAVFIVTTFLVFVPLAETSLTSMAIEPVKQDTVTTDSPFLEINFSINTTYYDIHVKTDECNKDPAISVYAYKEFLSPDKPVEVAVSEGSDIGRYECRFLLCEDAACNTTIAKQNKTFQII